MTYLNCKDLSFKLNDNQLLSCNYLNQNFDNVQLIRNFPTSKPWNYISICYEQEDKIIELGIIENIEELDEYSKNACKKSLSLRYLLPIIIKINKRTLKKNCYVFSCQTSFGNKDIIMKEIGYNVFKNNNDLLIKDIDENYYLIENYENSKDKHIKFLRSYL